MFHFEEKNNDVRLSEISSVAVKTHRCNINNSNNNTDQIEVYPGETITIDLKAYDLNCTPTYAQIFTRMTKSERWKFIEHHIYSDDITYLLPVAQQIQTVYSNSCTSLYLSGSVMQAYKYNSDIHFNGFLYFLNNKASYGAVIRLDSLFHLFILESNNSSFVNQSCFFLWWSNLLIFG